MVDHHTAVVNALIHVVVIPLMVGQRESLQLLADGSFCANVLQAVILELLPLLRSMVREIAGSAAVSFCGLTGDGKILDQIVPRLVLLVSGLQRKCRIFQTERQRQRSRMYHGTTPGVRGKPLSEILTQTSALELCIPCSFNGIGVKDGIHDFLRQLLTASHIYNFDFFIVESIRKKQDVEVALNIAVNTAVRQIHIRKSFNVD